MMRDHHPFFCPETGEMSIYEAYHRTDLLKVELRLYNKTEILEEFKIKIRMLKLFHEQKRSYKTGSMMKGAKWKV